MDVLEQFNVKFAGPEGGQPMVFAHGFGCDQNMWRYLIPRFSSRFRIISFDYQGHGGSKFSESGTDQYTSLAHYAEDLLAICRELGLQDIIFVGHSVSSIIGVLAEIQEPQRFAKLVMVGPSPCYINDPPYIGGFSEADIEELLDSLESNYLGWSSAMAPVIMGNGDRPELSEELKISFCRTDPEMARRFARATFLSDNRDDLKRVSSPSLVLQCRHDAIAPVSVGEFVTDAIPDCSMVLLNVTGHCPHLSSPGATAAAIAGFVGG